MSDKIEVVATHETDLFSVEITVNLELYYESADPDVGIFGSCFSPDGYKETAISFYSCDEDGRQIEWNSRSEEDVKTALIFLRLGGVDVDLLIDEACDKAADEFSLSDYDDWAD